MKVFTVDLPGGRGYPVVVGGGALLRAAEFAAGENVVVSNPTVFNLYGEKLTAALRAAGKSAAVVLMEDGEQYKTLQTMEKIIDGVAAAGLGRGGGIAALGGGVVGDVAGFAAAAYMRGVQVLQIPTTLLAQVDAAIGGKTGVNIAAGKNLVGAFWQPAAVLCDVDLLDSLPAREFRAGLAEVVKYGMLGDAEFFAFLEENADKINGRDAAVLADIVERSARCKAAVVAADETEQSGRRALLNLGHTFAHAAEAAGGYGAWLHGEAVAFGLAAAAKLSEEMRGFAAAETGRVVALLRRFGLPVAPPGNVADDALLAAMRLDKKKQGQKKMFVVMNRIGEALLQEADDAAARRALEALRPPEAVQ